MKKTYYLEDITERHKSSPRTFLKPTDDDINRLKAGTQVRLIFAFNTPMENGCTGERMWVEIFEINNSNYKGYLVNRPAYLTDIRIGDVVEFTHNNIATVLTKAAFDEDKKGIISRRALEKREINWVLRDEPLNDEDSGWQLFYGDEDEEYTDDPKNATIIPLSEVLQFEPRLETVFASTHNAFEWDEDKTDFVEVTDFNLSEE